MGAFSGIGDLIKQFAGNNAGDTGQLLQQLAGSAPQSTVAGGLAEAFKSDQTATFSQLASHLFSNSSGDQKASVLNSLVAAVGPSVLSQLTGSSSSTLAGLLQGNQAPITPEHREQPQQRQLIGAGTVCRHQHKHQAERWE